METQTSKFELGEIVITPTASAALQAGGQSVEDFLARHQAGDWGKVSDQARAVNERGLAEQFNLQEVALRVWGLDLPAEGLGAPVEPAVHDFANTLAAPYCGNNTDFTPARWLHKKPASLAMLSLRAQPHEPAFGLLVLGSDDPERFTPEMGTTFLQTVSSLASAAPSRLQPAVNPQN